MLEGEPVSAEVSTPSHPSAPWRLSKVPAILSFIPRLTAPVQQRYLRLGAEVTWILAGQAVAAAGGVFGVRLLTTALPVDNYGELALAMTVAALGQQVVLGPLSGAALRFFASAVERGQLESYLAALKRLLLESAALVLALAVLCHTVALAPGLRAALPWVPVTFLFALISGTNTVADGIQNAARQRRIVAWHQGLGQWLRYGLAIGCVALLGTSGIAAMWGYTIASALVLTSQCILLMHTLPRFRHAQPNSSGQDVRAMSVTMFRYGLPFSTWALLRWARSSADPWMIQTLRTAREVGLYQVLYQLGYYPIVLVSTAMMQFIAPILFARAGDGSDASRFLKSHRMNLVLVWICLATTALGVVLSALLHRAVFWAFVAPAYRDVSALLPLMVLSGGLFAAGQTSSLALMTAQATSALIKPNIVTALLGIALSAAGAALWGIPGVLAGGCVYSLAYVIWMARLMCQIARPGSSALHPDRSATVTRRP